MCLLDDQNSEKFVVILVEGVEWLSQTIRALLNTANTEGFTSSKASGKRTITFKTEIDQSEWFVELMVPSAQNSECNVIFSLPEDDQGRGWPTILT